ncbi:MAG: sulfite exporter TauE/SafE family protein [Lewinellaceae bacterium]|nr:sulfite exporter TauE/SafE family protein [Lewinellaceae bacterium]
MLWTALILGLAGSLHCAGMCGPLMLALPLPVAERFRLAGHSMVYQLGRILTYAALGLFFGLLGKGLAMAGFQQVLSVLAGSLLLGAAIFALRWEAMVLSVGWIRRATQWVQLRIGKLLREHPGGASFSIGLLNGLLPCGLVYAALAGAITTTDGWMGSAYMAVFGLGTTPLLLILMLSGQRIGAPLRSKFRVVQPLLLALTGIILLSRGLHLDLSLFESAVPPANYECH